MGAASAAVGVSALSRLQTLQYLGILYACGAAGCGLLVARHGLGLRAAPGVVLGFLALYRRGSQQGSGFAWGEEVFALIVSGAVWGSVVGRPEVLHRAQAHPEGGCGMLAALLLLSELVGSPENP